MVSARAPHGFDRIEDLLSTTELTTLPDVYRAASLQEGGQLAPLPVWGVSATDVSTVRLPVTSRSH